MKKPLSFFLALVLLLGTFAGCSPAADPVDSADSADSVSDSVSGTTPTEPEVPAITDFTLQIGDPVVIAQSEPGNNTWGSMQFPQLWPTPDGKIAATWDVGKDTIRYDGVPGWSLSADGGDTWVKSDMDSCPSGKNLMPNGCYFTGFTLDGARVAEYTHAIEPAVTWGDNKLFFKEDFPYNADSLITAREYDPKTGEYNSFVCDVNWPYAPMMQFPGNQIYPLTQIFSHNARTIITVDGVMYLAMYYWGFDSFADSREEAVMEYSNKYHCYIFSSADSGRTWDLLSQVYTDANITNSAEGLCEPEMSVMPDGSVIMLMRTGSNNPSWLVRSTDMCRTWSEPVMFDTIGVLPQLVTLGCGVTIATYGRPEMRIRATADPAGLEWKSAVTFPLKGGSCHYTDLIPLDDTTALWIYADFGYPNADGVGVRSIIARKITVVPAETKDPGVLQITVSNTPAKLPDTPKTPTAVAGYPVERTVKATSVTPTLDGVLTKEEWGDKPDFRLNAEITSRQRTYCLDQFGGAGNNIPDIEYYWRYDAENVYVALRIEEVKEYTTPVEVDFKGTDRALYLQMGNAAYTFAQRGKMSTQPTDGTVIRHTEKDGVRYYEIAIPRELTGNADSFTGYIEYRVTVYYERHDGIDGTARDVATRNTPVFSDGSKTHDLFVLDKEGKPAAAPEADALQLPAKTGDVQPNGSFTLTFGEPVPIAYGEVGNTRWGYMQFPRLNRTKDGNLLAMWDEGSDDLYYAAKIPRMISADGGKTWTESDAQSAPRMDVLMPNGKYFADFSVAGAHTETYLAAHTPAADYGNLKLYYYDDIKKDPAAAADVSLVAKEYDPKTGKLTEFDVTVNWPFAPIAKLGDLVYPFQQMFGLHTRAVIAVGKDLYLPMYFYGFDSFASSKDASLMELSNKYSVYVFKSSDSGRTWNLISQVYTTAEHTPGYSEGVCEPEMTVMPDGSFVMLMRTGGNNPSYIVRSTDKGVTWSDPVRFDDIGVLPQLLTLDCGVTLSTYGRPTMRLRATSDPTGTAWEPAIEIPLTQQGQSCHYTDLIALDENTALFIYSDFKYPNGDGEPTKTILVRTVTVSPN